MEQQDIRGRSRSTDRPLAHISQAHSPSPGPYVANEPSGSFAIDLNQHQRQLMPTSYDNFGGTNFLGPQQDPYDQSGVSNPNFFDPSAGFGQNQSGAVVEPVLSYNNQAQSSFLLPNLNEGDFSLFPPAGGQQDQLNAPLFEHSTLSPNDVNNTVPSPQNYQSPPSPHLQPGSAHHSPSLGRQQFSSPSVAHSRNASLGPEAALLSNQLGEWNQPQFQAHRRSPSDYSDVSSVSPSPQFVNSDNFDGDAAGHSPLQRASDGSLYQEVLGIGTFTLSEGQGHRPDQHGRSPSHSPAMSPHITPQQAPEMDQQGFGLSAGETAFSAAAGYADYQLHDISYSDMQDVTGAEMSHLITPAINIDFAPNNGKSNNFDAPKPRIDQDSLTPPDRGNSEPFGPSTLTPS